jgi:hypothetical protein
LSIEVSNAHRSPYSPSAGAFWYVYSFERFVRTSCPSSKGGSDIGGGEIGVMKIEMDAIADILFSSHAEIARADFCTMGKLYFL